MGGKSLYHSMMGFHCHSDQWQVSGMMTGVAPYGVRDVKAQAV